MFYYYQNHPTNFVKCNNFVLLLRHRGLEITFFWCWDKKKTFHQKMPKSMWQICEVNVLFNQNATRKAKEQVRSNNVLPGPKWPISPIFGVRIFIQNQKHSLFNAYNQGRLRKNITNRLREKFKNDSGPKNDWLTFFFGYNINLP